MTDFPLTDHIPGLRRYARALTGDAWMADVQKRAHRYPPGFVLDDSRESIYEGRGE